MRIARLLVISLLIAFPIIGETNKGAITGTVMDPNGLPVAGAKVTITNEATGVAITQTTSSAGVYTANTLEPALYDIRVEAANFKKALIQKVKVDTASTATVNVSVEIGTVSEEVTITGDTQTVNADSGTISQTVTERQLRDLPLNNRSVLEL